MDVLGLAQETIARWRHLSAMKPLIITVAPLGAEVTKAQTEFLPYTREAFAQTAVTCAKAGASVVHIHCRTEEGENTHDIGRFAEISAAVLDACAQAGCDVILQYSTGGSVSMTPEERSAPLRLNPEMATLNCGSTNFGDEIFSNPLPMIKAFAEMMQARDIVPEIEIYEIGHLDTAKRLAKVGLLRAIVDAGGEVVRPIHVDFVLGVHGAAAGTEANLRFLVSQLPPDWSWAVAGIARAELELAKVAIDMGGHVRVGLEDNIWLDRDAGRLARNEDLVARVAEIAHERGRVIATVDQARSMLGVHASRQRYVESDA